MSNSRLVRKMYQDKLQSLTKREQRLLLIKLDFRRTNKGSGLERLQRMRSLPLSSKVISYHQCSSLVSMKAEDEGTKYKEPPGSGDEEEKSEYDQD